MAGCAIRTGFAGHASLGAKANSALRFAPDHSMGADHTFWFSMRIVRPDCTTDEK